MEIGAIPGIAALSAGRARPAEFEAPAIFDIEGSAKPGDESAQRRNRKAAGAEENEEDDLLLGAEGEEGDESAQKSVDYFA
jgi:hypothetical protein